MPETHTQTWAQQVLEEHRDLRSKVGELREFLRRPRPDLGVVGAHTWAAMLSRKLVNLHDQLFRHFRFEEEGGMAEHISTRHPRAATAIDGLMSEHAEILRGVRRLMNEALTYSESRAPEDPALRKRVSDLLDRMAAHEHEETELVHRLEYHDLGVGD